MHNLLKYPFDPLLILKRRQVIKKELLSSGTAFINKNVAILGGSTTHDIKEVLELFLLDYGIKPSFFESDYGQYWQDAMFDNPGLDSHKPDIIFIHTSNRNITIYPGVKNSAAEIDAMLAAQYLHFETMWEKLREKYSCPIIQNNFEMPFYRLLGNKDTSDIHGRINYLNRLNGLFYAYAQNHNDFYINDINYLSANYGLEKWADPLYWHMYKYCLCVPAIPSLSFNVSNIIKSIFGKNKKALMIDLDNTIWKGVIGDDGAGGIEIGRETPIGQVFSEFQEYIKAYKELGVLLTVNSKNDYKNAIEGLNHPEGTLKPEDFIIIKANWQNKAQNALETARELNIGTDSIVLVDDNPAEREIVAIQFPEIAAPALNSAEKYITTLDRSGFFEVTGLSDDDTKRNGMYKSDIERTKQISNFLNYEDYLLSLEMTAYIKKFDDTYIQRIAQLTNKTNQFNLTTRRFTQSDMETMASNNDYICLYGKLIDKFGDNGVISVVIGRIDEKILHIELWLMSCRVLKRNMENAMLDRLVEESKKSGVKIIRGYYFITDKNEMVKDFYGSMGFIKISDNGKDTAWNLDIADYQNKNRVIKVY
jgi:FkbH-like protein